MSLLTLSRGTLLTQLVSLMLIYHFSKKQISGIKVACILVTLLCLASVYGVVRETVTYDDRGLMLNWGESCSSCDVGGSGALYKVNGCLRDYSL